MSLSLIECVERGFGPDMARELLLELLGVNSDMSPKDGEWRNVGGRFESRYSRGGV